MGYEHQPTPGAAVWSGAGLLVTVGGAALLWVSRVDAGDVALAVAGWIAVVVGLDGHRRRRLARHTSPAATRS